MIKQKTNRAILGFIATGFLIGGVSTTANAGIDIVIAPPVPRVVVVPPPRVGYVWAPGYWRWEGGRHVWAEGRWMPERRGHHWVPEHWDHRGERYHFEPGHWARN